MQKIILTDCDGVLLDYDWAFQVWLTEHGYELKDKRKLSYYMHHIYKDLSEDKAIKLIKQFNESAAIGFLPALRDSVFYVKKLYEEHGYKFRVITSLGTEQNAKKLREMNLHKLFGDSIESVESLPMGSDKDSALEPYKDSNLFWVEDKTENADLGYRLGLNSLLIEHGHNMNHKCPYPIVKNWKEIYNIITKEK